jgi:hypothetical protein
VPKIQDIVNVHLIPNKIMKSHNLRRFKIGSVYDLLSLYTFARLFLVFVFPPSLSFSFALYSFPFLGLMKIVWSLRMALLNTRI